MLFSELFVLEQKVDGLKKLGQLGCGENSNELTCCVEDRELNE
jgi:hypothetical protein